MKPRRKLALEPQPATSIFIPLLWCIPLALPNLVYSGVAFADTLHILKWAVTAYPILLACLVAGVMLVLKPARYEMKTDPFALLWLAIIIYCALQPLWVKVMSPTQYVLEMACFAAVWAFYVLSAKFPAKWLKVVLMLALVNAAVNVVFAELQIRDMNNLHFLEGTIFSDIIRYSSIILPTPGNYIGNTAQQNMFGLWQAVATLGGVWVFTFYRKKLSYLALGLTAITFWGLMNSTSRSATLALTGGLILMVLLIIWKYDRSTLKRFGVAMIVIALVFWASMYSDRSGQIVGKTVDIIKNYEEIGQRRGIWTTSAAMFLEHPMGVGIGQYKWHYLEAQRYGFARFPFSWYTWQYTHWAHNEFLQFFCEGGFIGGVMFLMLWVIWLWSVIRGLLKKKEIASSAVWGICLTALISFCAVFTRPFHRIENMVWITLAFSMSNREFLPATFAPIKTAALKKLAGIACVCAAVAGGLFLASGIRGNYVLRQALSTQNPGLQLYYLQEAEKHPIVYEETMRNVGYHYMQVGDQTDDTEALTTGFNILWEHFNHEPHSEDISKLLQFTQKYQIENVLREVASYFKPGTYHLKRIPQRDSEGNVVNALMLVNGPGEDDD